MSSVTSCTNPEVKLLKNKQTKSSKFWARVKNERVHQIDRSQFKKETNLKMRHYWSDVIREMERIAMQQAEQTKIKINDLSTSLPPKLYKRVSKIVPMIPIEEDRFENEADYDLLEIENQTDAIENKNEKFNESTMELIAYMDAQFNQFKLDIDSKSPTEISKSKKQPTNWQAEYICKNRKDRIKWNSKLYQVEANKIWERPLCEQAEELMNSTSKVFSQFVNGLSNNRETDISDESIKQLFSLDNATNLLRGISINPKLIQAVPIEIANAWNVPKMSLDFKLQKKLKEIRKTKPEKVIKVAFGRTVPINLRSWVPSDNEIDIKPVFPEEVQTCKILFEGMEHLRSVQQLIKYYRENPHEGRPKYLEQIGCFKNNIDDKNDEGDIPFYERVNQGSP